MATVTMPRNSKFTLCHNTFKKTHFKCFVAGDFFFPFCVKQIALLCLDLSEGFKFVSCNDFVSIFILESIAIGWNQIVSESSKFSWQRTTWG